MDIEQIGICMVVVPIVLVVCIYAILVFRIVVSATVKCFERRDEEGRRDIVGIASWTLCWCMIIGMFLVCIGEFFHV